MLLFWLSVVWIIYVYVGYPLTLWLCARRRSAAVTLACKPQILQQAIAGPDSWPSVTIVIAAFNEAKSIRATLENKLALDYPASRLAICVVSDASDDGTDALVQDVIDQCAGRDPTATAPPSPKITLLRQAQRSGKTDALNAALEQVCTDLVVMCDANSLYELHGLKHLVTAFNDPTVGYVTGRQVLIDCEGQIIGDGSSALMRYENWLRTLENRCGGVVGVDGGMDAIRTALYEPLRADQLPDFVQPLKVAEKGYKVLFEPRAVVMEAPNSSAQDEWRMRVRVATRAFHALNDLRHLLNPVRHPGLAFRLGSHKLLRYLAFIPLFALLLSSAALVGHSWIYPLAFVGQLVFYAGALWGYLNPVQVSQRRLVAIAYYFTLLNGAFAGGFWRFIRGKRTVIWAPRKG